MRSARDLLGSSVMRHRRDDQLDRQMSLERERKFVPRCCPYAHCPTKSGEKFKFIRWGTHERDQAPFVVQRFRCTTCKRTFSSQTFRLSYKQKRPDLDWTVL